MDHDFIADLHVRDVCAGGVDDAGSVGTTDVEVLGLARLLAAGDDIDGQAAPRPDVVVVHACGHHVDEGVVGADPRHGHDFGRERFGRLAEA